MPEYTDGQGKLTSRMLYDHASDPAENANVADARREAVGRLSAELRRRMGRDER